jgi:DNA (cytosine-5)-methyltransferase 1
MDNELAHITSPNDGLRELALFAGAGGGILGGKLLGWETVCAVEWEPYPAAVLAARQNEGFLPPFPIWDDVQTFDGRPWRGLVDVVSGGFPCQDISAAGKGAGITGERSGMWKHMARIIGEVRPRYAFVENSPVLTSRGLDVVLGDLAALGYDAEWGVLGAGCLGAPHERERAWLLAIDTDKGYEPKVQEVLGRSRQNAHPSRDNWWQTEPGVGRVADGVAARVDRLKAIGNGQVPAVVRLAWDTLQERIEKHLSKSNA